MKISHQLRINFNRTIIFTIVYGLFLVSSCAPVDERPNVYFKGIYLSEQTGTSGNGEPCYYLVQFFEDGFLIHSGICSESVKDDWINISQWFNRNSDQDLARGNYTLKGNKISFKVSAYFSQVDLDMTLIYEGEYRGSSLILNLLSETTGAEWEEMEFYRLELEE